MSFRDITPGRSNKGYAPLNNRNMYYLNWGYKLVVFDLKETMKTNCLPLLKTFVLISKTSTRRLRS